MAIRSTIALVMLHEGFSAMPYKCTSGKWTIGYGRNIEANPIPGKDLTYLQGHGITKAEARELLLLDLHSLRLELERIDEFQQCGDARQAVLLDMAYCMGMRGLLSFEKMWDAIRHEKYNVAANEILDSKFAKQTKTRAVRLSTMMSTGRWPDK